jgi:DNA-binding CsgD family transcriptional regulator
MLGKPLLLTLDRMGCGGVILDASGEVLELNPVANQVLINTPADASAEPLSSHRVRSALKALLREGETRFTLECDTWAVVERPDRRPLVIHSVPLSNGTDEGPHTMVILIDLDQAPQPNPTALQRMFGLTRAEAKLAVLLARGETLAAVAEELAVSMATARKQLASVFEKTRTNRQADLVMLLTRVSILP